MCNGFDQVLHAHARAIDGVTPVWFVGDEQAQRIRRGRINDDAVSRDPFVELAHVAGVPTYNGEVEAVERLRRRTARRRRHAIFPPEEFANHGLTEMPGRAEHECPVVACHAIPAVGRSHEEER